MKKIFCLIISVCLIFTLSIPNVAFAAVEEEQPEWQDIELSEEKIDEILSNNDESGVMSYASNLIMAYAIAIEKDGKNLIIVGKTNGIGEVVKVGFKKVIIQRRGSSSASWQDYKTYEDIYSNSRTYTLGKIIAVPNGYQYRVKCTHYAKKNILSTQTIDNVSNTVTF